MILLKKSHQAILFVSMAMMLMIGCQGGCCDGPCLATNDDIIECHSVADRSWDYEHCECVKD